MEPFTQTAVLNEELKNPHLVETLIRVAPSTGKRIQNADLNSLEAVFRAKLSGNIPEYDVNFNVQGVPLILTKQSHVELRLTPVFNSQVQITKTYLDIPSTFEFNRALWPKVNVACITFASATFSNFGVESPAPMLLPYLRYYRMDEDLRVNNSRAWNPSYLMPTGSNYVYNNRYISSPGNGCFPQPIHRSPYEVTLVQDTEPNRSQYYSWYGQPLRVQIPLEDVLPVFQIPVIPLRQTNTSNINIRIRLLSPRHMFFSCCYLNPNVAASYVNAQSAVINLQTNGIKTYVEEEVYIQQGTTNSWTSLQDAVLGGGTLAWLKALSSRPFCQYENIESFYVDFDVDCELVLHCLTTPLLNPLTQQYIEPFIDEQNQFVAHFADYYTFSQTLQLTSTTNARFVFSPSQLFYNTTHVALFFIQAPPNNNTTAAVLPKDLSGPVKVGDFMSIFKHGHFLLQENIDINQFQISLGSSFTPLFDRPLSLSEMLVATEDAMKKYNPNEMFGNVVGTQSRLYEGDAFFLFDLTHARNSGYFIDADNMIRVEGTVSYKQPLNQQILTTSTTQTANATGAPVLFGVSPTPRVSTPSSLNIHVIMMLIWQNTFTVLLDLDGAVLFQQQ